MRKSPSRRERYADRLAESRVYTLRALWRAQHLINAAFRRNPLNHAHFMDILRQSKGSCTRCGA